MAVSNTLSETLAERGSRYGDFERHAEISQAFEDVARKTPGWDRLSPAQKESLKLQWHKQARILNGDPNYDDSWVDIGGYAQLVVDIIRKGTGVVRVTHVPTEDLMKPEVPAPAPFRAPVIVAPPPAAQPPSVVAPPTLSLGTVKAPESE